MSHSRSKSVCILLYKIIIKKKIKFTEDNKKHKNVKRRFFKKQFVLVQNILACIYIYNFFFFKFTSPNIYYSLLFKLYIIFHHLFRFLSKNVDLQEMKQQIFWMVVDLVWVYECMDFILNKLYEPTDESYYFFFLSFLINNKKAPRDSELWEYYWYFLEAFELCE